MPFGLASSFGVFQRIMQKLFEGKSNGKFYQDDILTWGRDRKEHDGVLEKALRRLNKAELTMSLNMCKFAVNQVEYLGYTISENGISPKLKLMETIKEASSFMNKDQLRSFLGMSEYYDEFIGHFSDIAKGLRDLLKKNTTFVCTQDCEDAFSKIKNCIINAVNLKPFDVNDQSIPVTDASLYGLAAFLMQRENELLVSSGEQKRRIVLLKRRL